MDLPLAEESTDFFNFDSLESGVEVSVAPSAPSGAMFIEGGSLTRYVELQGKIKDLQNEAACIKEDVLEEVKPQWMESNAGQAKLNTSMPVCDSQGTEVKLVATSNVKSIPALTSTGKPNPKHDIVTQLMGSNVDKCYREVESYDFSLDSIPLVKREKVKEALAAMGIVPKVTLVPLEHMHAVGRIPAGPNRHLTVSQQQMLEDKLGARTFSLRTK